MKGFGGDDIGRLGQRRIVDRYIAIADKGLPLVLHDSPNDVLDMGSQFRILGHEQITDGIVAHLGQHNALVGHVFAV